MGRCDTSDAADDESSGGDNAKQADEGCNGNVSLGLCFDGCLELIIFINLFSLKLLQEVFCPLVKIVLAIFFDLDS